MKKTVLSVLVLAILVLSLSSCAMFQGEMNIAGSWLFSWQSVSSQRGLFELGNTESRGTARAMADIVQNGSSLSGTWHGNKDFAITGSIDKNGKVNISMSVNGGTCKIEGTVTGENSVFKKEGTNISGIIYFIYLDQTLSSNITGSRK